MAVVTFDGANLLIVVNNGVTELDVSVDLYSDWKEWTKLSDNAKYPVAFSVAGGEPTSPTNSISPYFFLENGWRLRPYEGNHELTITGALVVSGGVGNPVIPTVGSFNVLITRVVPVRAEVVATGGGSDPWTVAVPGAYAPGTAGAVLGATIAAAEAAEDAAITAAGLASNAVVAAELANDNAVIAAANAASAAAGAFMDNQFIEGSLTMRQAMRIMMASVAGKCSRVGDVYHFRDVDDTKDRIAATVVGHDRVAIVLDPT